MCTGMVFWWFGGGGGAGLRVGIPRSASSPRGFRCDLGGRAAPPQRKCSYPTISGRNVRLWDECLDGWTNVTVSRQPGQRLDWPQTMVSQSVLIVVGRPASLARSRCVVTSCACLPRRRRAIYLTTAPENY